MAKRPAPNPTPQTPADRSLGPVTAPSAAFDPSAFQAGAFQTGNELPPRISNAVVDAITTPSAFDRSTIEIAAPPSARTAPSEIRARPVETHAGDASFVPEGNLVADAVVIPAVRRVIVGNLATNTPDNRAAAQALLQATQAKISELRDARSNDRDIADLIDFLEWLSQGLTGIIENLDRAIAQPSEPMFLGTAGEIAHQLKLGLLEAVEKHRARIWEVGAVVGVACFLSSLSGEKLSDILRILFNRK